MARLRLVKVSAAACYPGIAWVSQSESIERSYRAAAGLIARMRRAPSSVHLSLATRTRLAGEVLLPQSDERDRPIPTSASGKCSG